MRTVYWGGPGQDVLAVCFYVSRPRFTRLVGIWIIVNQIIIFFFLFFYCCATAVYFAGRKTTCVTRGRPEIWEKKYKWDSIKSKWIGYKHTRLDQFQIDFFDRGKNIYALNLNRSIAYMLDFCIFFFFWSGVSHKWDSIIHARAISCWWWPFFSNSWRHNGSTFAKGYITASWRHIQLNDKSPSCFMYTPLLR